MFLLQVEKPITLVIGFRELIYLELFLVLVILLLHFFGATNGRFINALAIIFRKCGENATHFTRG